MFAYQMTFEARLLRPPSLILEDILQSQNTRTNPKKVTQKVYAKQCLPRIEPSLGPLFGRAFPSALYNYSTSW